MLKKISQFSATFACASVIALAALAAPVGGEAQADECSVVSQGVFEGKGATRLSDVRAKTDIKEIGQSLEKIRSLRGVTYRYKDDPSGRVAMGLIAQEVGVQFPEAIEDDEDFVELDYVALIAPLIEAAKELSAEVETNREYIQRLEKRLMLSEAELHRMRQTLGQ